MDRIKIFKSKSLEKHIFVYVQVLIIFLSSIQQHFCQSAFGSEKICDKFCTAQDYTSFDHKKKKKKSMQIQGNYMYSEA